MFKATRNQLANVCNNPFQGNTKKVLCVCSAGLLRSPTMANVLYSEFDLNTRSAGSNSAFALIPVSEALIHWADLIVFSDREAFEQLSEEARDCITMATTTDQVIVLSIPDEFNWNDNQLKEAIILQWQQRESK